MFKFEFFKYLNDLPGQFGSGSVKRGGPVDNLAGVAEALRVRAAYAVFTSVVLGIMKDKAAYSSRQLFNEVYQQDQLTFTQFHLAYYNVWSATVYIQQADIKCANLKKHLEALITLFGLTELSKDSAPLFECGYFQPGDHTKVIEAIKQLTAQLRPQYIPLVEAFDIPDFVLNSSIGNSYGDIYE